MGVRNWGGDCCTGSSMAQRSLLWSRGAARASSHPQHQHQHLTQLTARAQLAHSAHPQPRPTPHLLSSSDRYTAPAWSLSLTGTSHLLRSRVSTARSSTAGAGTRVQGRTHQSCSKGGQRLHAAHGWGQATSGCCTHGPDPARHSLTARCPSRVTSAMSSSSKLSSSQ